MSFESESVNENVFFVKGKVHCFVATIDGKELRQKVSEICIRYRFFVSVERLIKNKKI